MQAFNCTQHQSINSDLMRRLQSRADAGLQVCKENKQFYIQSLCYTLAIGIIGGVALIGSLALGLPVVQLVTLSTIGVLSLAVTIYICVNKKMRWDQSIKYEQVFTAIEQKNYSLALDLIIYNLKGKKPIDSKDPNSYRDELANRYKANFTTKSDILEKNFRDGWHHNCLALLY